MKKSHIFRGFLLAILIVVCCFCTVMATDALNEDTYNDYAEVHLSNYFINRYGDLPSVTVYGAYGNLLSEGTDYELEYGSSSHELGDYCITVKGLANYTFNKEVNYSVVTGSRVAESNANVFYKKDEESKVLHIFGNGAMPDFTEFSNPPTPGYVKTVSGSVYLKGIETMVIDGGVTTVGKKTISSKYNIASTTNWFPDLKTIIVPSSVTEFKSNAIEKKIDAVYVYSKTATIPDGAIAATTIYGYPGSTAEEYAAKYPTISFEPLCEHVVSRINRTEAKCNSEGYSGDYVCSECSELLQKGVAINPIPTEHDYGAWTKIDDFQHQRVCNNDNSHIEKEDHSWNEGIITKPPTTSANGIKTYTCTACNATRTETISKLPYASGQDPNQKASDGTSIGKGASAVAADIAITKSTSEEGPKGSKYAPLLLRSTKQGKTNVILTWNKVSGASKYVIYGNACGKKNKMKKLATVTGKTYNVKKINKALKKGTYHKFLIVALNPKNNVVSTSKVIHVATKGGKIGNPTKLTTKRPKTLRKGKTFKLSAKQTGKQVKKYRAISYESTNSRIAAVSSKGVIKAKSKGICYIYVYAQNGINKKVKVTVR